MISRKNILKIFPALIIVAIVLIYSLTKFFGRRSGEEMNEETPSEVVQAAVEGHGYFLENLSEDVVAHFGFSNKEELSAVDSD